MFVLSVLPVKDYVVSVFGFVSEPVSYWTSSVTTSINTSFISVSEIFSLREEYNNLKIQVAKLEAENSAVKIMQAEVDALKEQLKLGKSDIKHIQAQVVSNGVLGQGEYMVVNRGSRDGVKVGQRAVLGNVFIGIVTEVSERSAKVTLPVSKNLNLKVRVITGNVDEVNLNELQGDSRNLNFAYGVSTGNISGIQVENVASTFDVKMGSLLLLMTKKSAYLWCLVKLIV